MVRFADPELQNKFAKPLARAEPRPGWLSPQARVVESGEPMLLADGLPKPPGRSRHDGCDDDVLRAAGIGPMMVVPLHARGLIIGALTLASAGSHRSYSPDDLKIAQDLAGRVAMALDNARLYADAQRAIAARDGALALVSHDLRNPLGVILFRTELMLNRPAEADRRSESRRSIESMRRSAKRMTRLIQDLLDVSSIELGNCPLDRTRQPVVRLLNEVVEEQQSPAAAKSLRLTCDVEPAAGVELDCDRERLGQVFSNLIENAVKFTGPGGTIAVRAELRGNEVCFSVTDTGTGIPVADLPHVFNRFWQAQQTARQGTGLGLSIARGIVEAHGGHIWVESQVGVGTTFFFTIPQTRPAIERVDPASPTSTSKQATDPEGGSRQAEGVVLVTEDDDDVREGLCEILENAGYQVAAAANGAEALEYLHREPAPLVVVLDLMMPVMDGWTFLDERSRDPGLRSIPVLVVSGQHDVEQRVMAAQARYLRKPVVGDRLIDAIEQTVH
jgi:signal transduction histidine kinase